MFYYVYTPNWEILLLKLLYIWAKKAKVEKISMMSSRIHRAKLGLNFTIET